MVNKLRTIGGVLGLFITLPIWFYLMHFTLSQLNADRLVWFLYWIYVPVTILIEILIKFATE